jgi:excisionase family DNA binding protein
MTGLGRTKTYYLIAEGHLRAIKVGKRTLVDVTQGLAYLHAQPAAQIHAKRASA